MQKKFNIAVLGATGVIGTTILEILAERDFPIDNLYPLASASSVGELIEFNGKSIEVIDVETFDFGKADIALFSAGSNVSAKYAPLAAKKNCIVIDNTSCFRYEEDVPLVISEVNPEKIADYKKRNIIANPNCSTMQLLVALKPIYDSVGIDRINVSTYQAVSGSGKAAITELVDQTGKLLNGMHVESKVYPKQIAFNVIPHIDIFLENGYTKEEMKIVWETKKILNDENILVNATAVRVPVVYGHSESVNIETKKQISPEDVRKLYYNKEEIKLIDDVDNLEYPTPVDSGSGTDAVFVGRLRKDISHPNGLNMWVVADNVRKGGALNAVQIAEKLISSYMM